MKYEWDPEKNEWLKVERDISFERILFHLALRRLGRYSNEFKITAIKLASMPDNFRMRLP
jgi:hypothetical protein